MAFSAGFSIKGDAAGSRVSLQAIGTYPGLLAAVSSKDASCMQLAIPSVEPQVTEELLKSLGVEKCSDLIDKRGMLAALFSPVAMESFLSAG